MTVALYIPEDSPARSWVPHFNFEELFRGMKDETSSTVGRAAWQFVTRVSGFIDKEDMSHYVEPPGVGIAWIWKLPDSHPFFGPAVIHDDDYALMEEGDSPYETSAIPDLQFFQNCLRKCAEQPSFHETNYYIAQAETFYGLVRSWGSVRWPLERKKALEKKNAG